MKKYNCITLSNSKYDIGDKIKYFDIVGKIINMKYDEKLGWCYLVKYSFFNKKWAIESSLEKV